MSNAVVKGFSYVIRGEADRVRTDHDFGLSLYIFLLNNDKTFDPGMA